MFFSVTNIAREHILVDTGGRLLCEGLMYVAINYMLRLWYRDRVLYEVEDPDGRIHGEGLT